MNGIMQTSHGGIVPRINHQCARHITALLPGLCPIFFLFQNVVENFTKNQKIFICGTAPFQKRKGKRNGRRCLKEWQTMDGGGLLPLTLTKL